MNPALRAGRDGINHSDNSHEDCKAQAPPRSADATDEAGASRGLPPLLFVAGYRGAAGQEVNLIQVRSRAQRPVLACGCGLDT